MTDKSSELVASLVAEAVRAHAGAVGVILRDIPHLVPEPIFSELVKARLAGVDLRVAYLETGALKAARAAGFTKAHVTEQVQLAEAWRNQRELRAPIVVIARGDHARLSSLEEFVKITARQLKDLLVRRALAGPAGTNEVLGRWWTLLGRDSRISLGQLVDYYLALADRPPSDFRLQTSRQIHRLGLLPDAALFDNPAESAIRRRVELNRELLRRLEILTPQDRHAIAANIEAASDPETRARLKQAYTRLRAMRRRGSDLDQLDVTAAQELLGIRTARRVASDPVEALPSVTKVRVRPLVAETLVNHPERLGVLDTVVQRVSRRLAEIGANVSPREVLVVDIDPSTQVEVEVHGDLVNVVVKLIEDGGYGGLLTADGVGDPDTLLRRFQGDQDVKARWQREKLFDFLAQLTHPAISELQARFEAYDDARGDVLPLARLLCVEPLLAAAAPSYRLALQRYVASYQQLLEHLQAAYPTLRDEFGSDVDEVFAYVLALETIVFRGDNVLVAFLTSTHPLYLWHAVEFCRVVDAQRELLSEPDRQLVVDAAKDLPIFLASLCIPYIAAGVTRALPQIGRLGPLPYFGQQSEANLGSDGSGLVARLIHKFFELNPPARLGLRLALLDPPDPGLFLSMCTDLAEAGELGGATVLMLRHASRANGAELGLPLDEEERIARYFRATTNERRFFFDTRMVPDAAVDAPDGASPHIFVAFDQTPGRATRIQPTQHVVQPLAVSRRLRYRALQRTVELEPAPGGVFAAYEGIVDYFDRSAQASYFSMHQQAELRAAMETAALQVPWYIVVDRSVDRDLKLGVLRVFTGCEGTRDVAAFTRSLDVFRRPLREVVRQYNTAISDQDLDALLGELSELLDAGVLRLGPDRNGNVNAAAVKGVLGTLIAARWYRGRFKAGERLLVSLDGEQARRWLRLSPDPLRADLLGFEFTNGQCVIDVLEVKAVQEPRVEYQVVGGIASGSAIDQVLSTRRLILEMFEGDRAHELITTPARREILREHVFRELTKMMYAPDQRKAWAEALELFFDGRTAVSVRCHIVEVHLGVDAASLTQRNAHAQDEGVMVPVWIVQLNESEVEALSNREQGGADTVPTTTRRATSDRLTPEFTSADGALAETQSESVSALASERSDAITAVAATPDLIGVTPRQPADRIRAYLGDAPGAYGRPVAVWFDPEDPAHRLPNAHIALTGETGSGKTQAIKALLFEFKRFGIPVLVLDFKDDYSQSEYAQAESFAVYDASAGGLPFNLMAPPIDPQSGTVNLINHVHQLGEIVKRIYRLGDQQAFRLRESMKQVYSEAGLARQRFVPTEHQRYPSFDQIEAVLRSTNDGDTLLGRLSPIFDLQLFATESVETAFSELVGSSTVIRLSQLPGDEVKNAVAEFFLMALYNFLIRQPHPHALRRVLVLDEAWRLAQSPFLEPLMREGRAFGAGVVIATQFPGDLPPAVSGSTATKLFFSQTKSQHVREIQRTLLGKTSGADAQLLGETIRGLPPLACLLQNSQYEPPVRLTVRPHFERLGSVGDSAGTK